MGEARSGAQSSFSPAAGLNSDCQTPQASGGGPRRRSSTARTAITALVRRNSVVVPRSHLQPQQLRSDRQRLGSLGIAV